MKDALYSALAVLVLIFIVLLFPAAGNQKTEAAEKARSLYSGLSSYEIVIDEETGCEYITKIAPEASLTPRYDAQGRHICKSPK